MAGIFSVDHLVFQQASTTYNILKSKNQLPDATEKPFAMQRGHYAKAGLH